MAKIMIVDDDPHIRELVCALLKNGGFETCEAKDGALHPIALNKQSSRLASQGAVRR